MKKVITILTLFLLSSSAFAQAPSDAQSSTHVESASSTERESKHVEVYFEHDTYKLDLDFQQNRANLEAITDLVNTLSRDSMVVIAKIDINSYTSPEGGRTYNDKLSINRTNSIYDYFKAAVPHVDSLIVKTNSGIDWEYFEELVEASDMQYRDEVLHILRTVPEETWRRVNPSDRWLSLVDSRNKHIMQLRGGEPYRYMFKNIYPQLRRGSVVTVSFRALVTPVFIEVPTVAIKEVEPAAKKLETIPETKPIVAASEPTVEIKPLLALKTNLLYDLASVINVELEVPIGNRWSVAGEWIFPWWSSSWDEDSHRNCLQILNGNLEGKYWFGDRTSRPVMTGWHLGLYAGGGLYDLSRNATGYQGEFFIAAGLSGGYAHTINKSGNLRLEYSAAVGYLKTDYDKYAEHWGIDNSWHTLRQESGNYSWIGPTRARVSLVWMLNRKVNKEK
ncbi:MAG: DUF3575 domain-containing protein [Rikenellaceae bacterium]